MNIIEFQKILKNIVAAAGEREGRISQEEVRAFFTEQKLDGKQLERVYAYLLEEKIQVEGIAAGSKRGAAKREPQPGKHSEKPTALSLEEQQYLARYKEMLSQMQLLSGEPLKKAVKRAIEGDDEARRQVAEAYMPKVAETAVALHYEQLFLGDVIAEGNLSLLLAMDELEDEKDADRILQGAIRRGIKGLWESQRQQNQQDQSMVEKVQSLEDKIKEITDDGKMEFSVDELAVFLDMTREEIEAVLCLAGEGQEK